MFGSPSYPPNTYITCVLVTGEGHGQKYLKSPEDAYQFIFQRSRAVEAGFFSDEVKPLDVYRETIRYEIFAEFWIRKDVFRLFPPHSRDSRGISVLQIADALRIAGIEEL